MPSISVDDLPKFGPGGSEPPLTSKPVFISAGFFGAGLSKASPEAANAIRLLVSGQEEVSSRFPEPVAWARDGSHVLQLARAQLQNDPKKTVGAAVLGTGVIAAVVATGGLAGLPAAAAGLAGGAAGGFFARNRVLSKLTRVEFRRVVYSQQWIRDSVMQIPPDSKQTFSSSRTIGISATKSKDLSLALGFKHAGRVDLGTDISKRIETTVTVHQEQADTSTQEFSNPRSGYYRRIACWYVQHVFVVDALIASSAATAQSLQWVPRQSASFTEQYSGQNTYADVPA
jgi:hypothetical protein